MRLMEILIVIVIVVILSAIVLGNFGNYRADQALQNSAEGVLSLLNDARSRTLSSEDSSQYGTHLEQTKVVLFKGSTYSAGAAGNVEFILDPAIEIVSISLTGGGSDVIFQRLSGETTQDGTFVVRVEAEPGKQKSFTIIKTGIISFD